jgi:hypothetical protein
MGNCAVKVKNAEMQIDEAHHQNCFLLRKMDCARAKIP